MPSPRREHVRGGDYNGTIASERYMLLLALPIAVDCHLFFILLICRILLYLIRNVWPLLMRVRANTRYKKETPRINELEVFENWVIVSVGLSWKL